jgi:hypothetical protein
VSGEQGKEHELAEVLARYYEAHDKDRNFMQWAIQNEVNRTDEPDQLFRKGSFVTQLMFRQFSDKDAGLKYLKSTVLPLVAEISEMSPSELEIEPEIELKMKPEQVDKNLNFLLEKTSKLIERLSEDIFKCPINIRLGFSSLHEEVIQKFPSADSVVSVILFLRYLCPTILQPHAYGLMSSAPSPEAFKALVVVTKLLQNCANRIAKNNISVIPAHNNRIKTFITTHMETVKEFCDIFIDKKHIKYCDKIQGSTLRIKKKLVSEKEKQEVLQRVHACLSELCKVESEPSSDEEIKVESIKEEKSSSESELRRSGSGTNTNQNSPPATAKPTVDIVQSILDQAYENWRVDREKNNFRLLVKKEKKKTTKDFLVSVFNFKGEGQIGASVEQVLEYFRSMPISDWILLENSVNQENTRKLEKIDEDKDDWIMRVKFPFPFQDRDVVFQRVIGTKSSHEGYLVCYSIDRPDVQSPKGVVRANMTLGITVRTALVEPIRSSLMMTISFDPKGTVPKWLFSASSKKFLEIITALQVRIEYYVRRTTKSASQRALMYRSVGHSGDSQRQRRRSFHQNDASGRVNSQVFDLRSILKEGPNSDLHSSKSDSLVHAEKDREKDKEKDKDKRKQHLSKNANRSSLNSELIASFKREHTKALDKRERRRSTVVLMSARRDVDGNVIGEDTPDVNQLPNNTNQGPSSSEQEPKRPTPEKTTPPKEMPREYPPITTISSPSRPASLHSSHPQDKRLHTRTSEKVLSNNNVNTNGATVERQRKQALSFDTSSIPSRSKSTVDVKKNRHRSHTPRRTGEEGGLTAHSSPGLFELPEEDNEHEKVKPFKHEKKVKSTPHISLDDGYTPEEREGPLSSYSHIGEYDSGSD